MSDLIIGKTFDSPQGLYRFLVQSLTPFMVQSGEFGPLAQVISRIDIAGWDLVGQKLDKSISSLVSDTSKELINTYASALDVNDAGAAGWQRRAFVPTS